MNDAAKLMADNQPNSPPVSSYKTLVLEDSPLGYWPMNEGEGVPKAAWCDHVLAPERIAAGAAMGVAS